MVRRVPGGRRQRRKARQLALLREGSTQVTTMAWTQPRCQKHPPASSMPTMTPATHSVGWWTSLATRSCFGFACRAWPWCQRIGQRPTERPGLPRQTRPAHPTKPAARPERAGSASQAAATPSQPNLQPHRCRCRFCAACGAVNHVQDSHDSNPHLGRASCLAPVAHHSPTGPAVFARCMRGGFGRGRRQPCRVGAICACYFPRPRHHPRHHPRGHHR
jgi:hypothetical protein